ncbi:hypothetical protein EG68_06269 [Paragonimus skrjabini miyazakii]|uniref:Uncharacterized protein n=1 Tax=Paragonimus skrjabini miyazakii TaxID=59628 RepID=A0A8S9YQ25_9TREM|nr:hypothetical protein EG68_06269 [Paragonimus skrjabini miyazakii]
MCVTFTMTLPCKTTCTIFSHLIKTSKHFHQSLWLLFISRVVQAS